MNGEQTDGSRPTPSPDRRTPSGEPGSQELRGRIESARVGDAEAILKLQYLCYQSEAALYDDYALPALTQRLASLLDEYDTHRILVARCGDEVVGSVRGRAQAGTGYIGRLMVHPRFQRQGLGTMLMRAIESRLASTVQRYEIFTGHRSTGNLRLYARLGYTELRRETRSERLEIVYLEKPPAT